MLMEIAEKWNECVEIDNNLVYFPVFNKKIKRIQTLSSPCFGLISSWIPFYFNSRELCDKSIELHPELWSDLFMIADKK